MTGRRSSATSTRTAGRLSGENPVRFLNDLWPATMESVDRDEELRARIETLAAKLEADLAKPHAHRPGIDGPVVFMCAEFGFHQSMPIYSGGLGVLAGDILKEASDQALEMIGIGLLYRRGYFRQRLDIAGRQQEYWLDYDPKSMPMARVARPDGTPLLLDVTLSGVPLHFQVWRVDVGRVPLLLLDAGLSENDAVQQWTSGAPVREQPLGAARPVRPARHGRRAGARGARHRAFRHPPERRASRARRAGARRTGGRTRRSGRGSARADPAQGRLHDAHAGRRRERDLRARRVPARLRRPARAARARRGRVPRALQRRARRDETGPG